MSESAVQREIFRLVGGRQDVRIFRNNVGQAWMGQTERLPDGSVIIRHPRRVVFGLCPGSSDLIGWQTVVITPEMVGRTVARFLAVEVKDLRGRLREEQVNFIRVVNECGGVAGVARGGLDALEILGREL